MIRILLLGLHTVGAIRHSLYAVTAGMFSLIFMIGTVNVMAAGDWIDALLLAALTVLFFYLARRQYRVARQAVLRATSDNP